MLLRTYLPIFAPCEFLKTMDGYKFPDSFQIKEIATNVPGKESGQLIHSLSEADGEKPRWARICPKSPLKIQHCLNFSTDCGENFLCFGG